MKNLTSSLKELQSVPTNNSDDIIQISLSALDMLSSAYIELYELTKPKIATPQNASREWSCALICHPLGEIQQTTIHPVAHLSNHQLLKKQDILSRAKKSANHVFSRVEQALVFNYPNIFITHISLHRDQISNYITADFYIHQTASSPNQEASFNPHDFLLLLPNLYGLSRTTISPIGKFGIFYQSKTTTICIENPKMAFNLGLM